MFLKICVDRDDLQDSLDTNETPVDFDNMKPINRWWWHIDKLNI